MTLITKQNKHRTMVYDGTEHVGTIIEQGKKLFQWITRSENGHVDSFALAFAKIEADIGIQPEPEPAPKPTKRARKPKK